MAGKGGGVGSCNSGRRPDSGYVHMSSLSPNHRNRWRLPCKDVCRAAIVAPGHFAAGRPRRPGGDPSGGNIRPMAGRKVSRAAAIGRAGPCRGQDDRRLVVRQSDPDCSVDVQVAAKSTREIEHVEIGEGDAVLCEGDLQPSDVGRLDDEIAHFILKPPQVIHAAGAE